MSHGIDGVLPPHDHDAEAAVVSAVFARGRSGLDDVRDLVTHEEFYSEAHRRMFEAAWNVDARGMPVDVVTVASELKDTGRLEQVGGAAYLHQVLDAAPAVLTDHLQAYAKRVRSKARLRRLAVTMQRATATVYGDLTEEQADDLFNGVERDLSDICAQRHRTGFEAFGAISLEVKRDIDEHVRRGGGIAGVPTGFTRLDNMTGGLHGGDVTIVAARPGMGKTSFVLNVASNVTDTTVPRPAPIDYAAAIFSLEMPRKQLVARVLCSNARANLAGLRNGKFGSEERQRINMAASDMYKRGIYIDDTPGLSVMDVRSKLRRLAGQLAQGRGPDGKPTSDGKPRKIGVVAIDYLTLMDFEDKRGETRDAAIGRTTRALKNIAKELDVPFMVLAQLSRAVESRTSKRPQKHDLRDSGNIEQDADNIVFIYRDDYYDDDSPEKNIAEFIVAKQRNGPEGTIKLRFDREWTRFDNLAEGEWDDN